MSSVPSRDVCFVSCGLLQWIGLFFGADWVPPARKFRPLLQMLHASLAEKAPGTFEVRADHQGCSDVWM
jgi:hypothetical protein